MKALVECRTPYILVGVLLLPVSGLGHHSSAGRYDAQSVMEVAGEITIVSWRNPHAKFSLRALGSNGERVTWQIEAGSPNTLRRSGIEPDALEVGDRVRVAGWPPLTSEREIFVTNVLTSEGDELIFSPLAGPRWNDETVGDRDFLFQTEGDSSQPELGIFRVWSHSFLGPFLFPGSADPAFDVYTYPLTEAAAAAVQAFDGATNNPTRDCNPKGMPLIMEQPYPMEFVQADDTILLRLEEYDLVRTIHMDPEAASAERSASLLGHSLGRWEGASLVVTTTDIDWPWFNQLGIPQSGESDIVERFSPTNDGSRLDYELTISDPINFTGPVTLRKFWLYLPGQTVEPYNCVVQ